DSAFSRQRKNCVSILASAHGTCSFYSSFSSVIMESPSVSWRTAPVDFGKLEANVPRRERGRQACSLSCLRLRSSRPARTQQSSQQLKVIASKETNRPNSCQVHVE